MFPAHISVMRLALAAGIACYVALLGARFTSAVEGIPSAAARPALDEEGWFKGRDKNGDGQWARDEFWDAPLFGEVDANQDGFATPAELLAYYADYPTQLAPARGQVARAAPQSPVQAVTAADVEIRPVVIWSDGTRMAGDLYLPRNRQAGEKLPGIVFCAGTGGTKKGLPTRLGPILARAGYVCLGFDYRGWGDSEARVLPTGPVSAPNEQGEVTVTGKPIRWQMNLMDQTFDIRAAISFLQGEPDVDPERIGLFGSSYGGGLVTLMAAIDPRVKCAAAQVGGLGIGAAADKFGYALLRQQARGETEPVPIETGKLGGQLSRYEQMRRNPARSVGFGEKYEVVGRIRIPMIFVDAEHEELLNTKENGEKFAAILKANGVPVEYHVIPGISHYGIYREGFTEATRLELAWFDKHLKQARAPAVPAAPPASAPTAPPVPPPPAAPRPAVEQGFQKMDADGDGKLTAAEFATIRQGAKYFQEHPEAIGPVFQRLDSNGDGALTLDEYRKILRAAGQGTPASPPNGLKTDPAADGTSSRGEPVGPAAGADEFAFFETHIRPVLVARCYACHSTEAEELQGGLSLDTREALLAGGDSGPAVVPGNVRNSLLITALRHEDGLEMPPKEKLSDREIADFVRWVETGAPDPRVGSTPVAKKLNPEAARNFWAFQPPRAVAPPNVDGTWAESDIDRFLSAAQQRAGVSVVADAPPEALVRRLYFDLVGLPPSPEESMAFVNAWQSDAQQALAHEVDVLLASPHFGERWGRHWLDVARYAESSGKETNFSYPQAWRYRDYVIESFNADVPFDRLIREQLAGDLLPAADDATRARQIVATGLLALGPKSHVERNALQFEMDVVDEQIDAVSQAFLGLTVACARCHDHKFDPIAQRDYYALAGIFRSTETCYGTIPIIQNNHPSPLIELPADCGLPAGIPAATSESLDRMHAELDRLAGKLAELRRTRNFATSEAVQTGILYSTLKAKPALYEDDGTPRLLTMGVRDHQQPRNSPLYVRGEVEKPGDEVPRGFVQVLWRQPQAPSFPVGSGRRELAEWIAARDNPLTARVYVNRVWSKLFGRGLVATPDNFGASGQAPTHPELLDYLAVRFMQDGWSTKQLIRRLVLSRAYRLATDHDARNFEIDPDNMLVWRMSPRRLDAEAIRDAMLATAGVLELEPPIGSVVARGGEGYTGGIERGGQLAEARFRCRSVYLPALRGRLMESLEMFDGVDGSSPVGERSETTVPMQSLYLMNSPYVMALAQQAGARLAAERSDIDGRIDLAYRRWFGRPASDVEQSAAREFIADDRRQSEREGRPPAEAEQTAWATFCQSLWASGEFLARN